MITKTYYWSNEYIEYSLNIDHNIDMTSNKEQTEEDKILHESILTTKIIMVQELINDRLCIMLNDTSDKTDVEEFIKSNRATLLPRHENYKIFDILLGNPSKINYELYEKVVRAFDYIEDWYLEELLSKAYNEKFLNCMLDLFEKRERRLSMYFTTNIVKCIAADACRRGYSPKTVDRVTKLGQIDCNMMIISSFNSTNMDLVEHLIKNYTQNVDYVFVLIQAATKKYFRLFDKVLYLIGDKIDFNSIVKSSYSFSENSTVYSHIVYICSLDKTETMIKILKRYTNVEY